MPSVVTEPARPVLSNSTNSSFDGHSHPRKSHDKTISGVFTYTNGTDVETGLPDHKLDQIRTLHNASHSSLPNGLPNGSLKPLDRSHSQAGSTHSSSSVRSPENIPRSPGSSDGLSRLSNVEIMADRANGAAKEPAQQREPNLAKLQVNIPPTRPEPEASHMATASTVPDTAWDGGITSLSPTTSRNVQPTNRFSSPSGLSPVISHQSYHKDSAEMPPLAHRHTLGVPRAGPARASRDFSFTGGASEEALHTTGRFSPTRDYFESTIRHRRPSLGLVRRPTRSQSDAYLDEYPLDEDAARWTEAIRQKRASRRKWREEEDDDRVIVGKKVEEGHVNWVTAYNMLTGIRFTVSRTNAKIDRDLNDADFDAKHKFSFDITGNELTPSAKYDFKFKDYAPWVFRHLRYIFGLDPADYLMSLTSKYILSELGSPGKSGSFFYFSRDYKYIIKTIHYAEHKLLRKILRDYYAHVLGNPNTLLSQIYGLHRVKIPYGRKIHFLVMNNLFPPHRDIHQTFDLKGSTVGRDFREDELADNPRATLKDLNWLRRDYHLEFDQRLKQRFIEQLHKDVALLQKLQIMDYSLLVGIHDVAKGNEENLRGTTLRVFQPGGNQDDEDPRMLMRTPSRLENARKARELRLTLKRDRPVPIGQTSTKMPEEMASDDMRRGRLFYRDDGGVRATHEDGSPGELIYYLGVIDCLTHYGLVKRLEHFWKGLKDSRTQISPIPPLAYGERFINFITGITMTKEEAERRRTTESQRQDGQPIPPRSRSRGSREGATVNLGVSLHPPSEPWRDEVRSPGSPAAVEKTMHKAQKQVDRETSEKGRRKSEEEKPKRTLQTTEEGPGNTLLPVVSEEDVSGKSSRTNSADKRLQQAENHRPQVMGTRRESTRESGIRMVSASTDRDSHEDEKQRDAQEKDDDVKRRNQPPPRINSDVIPQFSPIYAESGRGDPEKG